MSLQELLQELTRRGVHLAAEGERLIYRGPSGALTDDLRQEIINHKAELLPMLRRAATRQCDGQSNLAGMTLAEFARSRHVVRVRSRLLGEDVWWVSDATLQDAVPDSALVVYTAAELRHLVGISPQDLINIHRIKRTLCGHIEN